MRVHGFALSPLHRPDVALEKGESGCELVGQKMKQNIKYEIERCKVRIYQVLQ